MTETQTRMAACVYRCGSTIRSDTEHNLFGFEDRSAGSRYATETCKHCRYTLEAHERFPGGSGYVCASFEPIGAAETDSYYCGCRGWD